MTGVWWLYGMRASCRDRLGDDQVGLFAEGDRAELVADTHSVCGVDRAGIE